MIENVAKGKNIAIIPARGGSKGVPHKNIRLLNGFPLLVYSIAVCQMSEKIQRVIVSTDSEEIADIAKHYGAEVPFIRPAEFSGDQSGDIEFVKHALHWLQENEGEIPEFLIHIRPTTPLRDVHIVDEAIKRIEEDKEATSLRSAHKASESPYKWFLKNAEGYYKSIIEGLSTNQANDGRQGFPDAYIPDGYIDVLKTEFILKYNQLHGDKMIAFESPTCTEVDTIEEFELLEYEINKKNPRLYTYIKDKFK